MRTITQLVSALAAGRTPRSLNEAVEYPTAAVYELEPEISPSEVVVQYGRLVKLLGLKLASTDRPDRKHYGAPDDYQVSYWDFLGPLRGVSDFVRKASIFARDRSLPWPADAAEIERRIMAVQNELPRWIMELLTGGKIVEATAALEEKVYRLNDKHPSDTKRIAKHLLIGTTKLNFGKLYDAFVKDNPEADFGDFKIALLVMADDLAKSRGLEEAKGSTGGKLGGFPTSGMPGAVFTDRDLSGQMAKLKSDIKKATGSDVEITHTTKQRKSPNWLYALITIQFPDAAGAGQPSLDREHAVGSLLGLAHWQSRANGMEFDRTSQGDRFMLGLPISGIVERAEDGTIDQTRLAEIVESTKGIMVGAGSPAADTMRSYFKARDVELLGAARSLRDQLRSALKAGPAGSGKIDSAIYEVKNGLEVAFEIADVGELGPSVRTALGNLFGVGMSELPLDINRFKSWVFKVSFPDPKDVFG